MILPDEMLLNIFTKLNMIDKFYSLVEVNQRFDRLTLDSLHIYHLDFATNQDKLDHNSSVDTLIFFQEFIRKSYLELMIKFTLGYASSC